MKNLALSVAISAVRRPVLFFTVAAFFAGGGLLLETATTADAASKVRDHRSNPGPIVRDHRRWSKDQNPYGMGGFGSRPTTPPLMSDGKGRGGVTVGNSKPVVRDHRRIPCLGNLC